MLISFTGDVCFGDVNNFTNTPFKNIGSKLSQINCVINLEAPFLPDGEHRYPDKSKISLRSFNDSARFLKQINPFLVNLANNHINDFGNYGAENTKRILQKHNFNYFGAGLPDEDHNIFVYEEEKIVLLTYATRSVDLSGTKLFEDAGFIGPKEYSLNLVQHQLNSYQDFKKIVLFHWGIEDIHYPIPEQVQIGRELVDAGIDLVIGNHPHVVQSYEKYKGKWIFYCLGHLYFPHFKSVYLGKDGNEKVSWDIHSKDRNTSIIPVFKIESNVISLKEILAIQTTEDFIPFFINRKIKYNLFLFKNIKIYNAFYQLRKRVLFIVRLPYRAFRFLRRKFIN